MREWPDPRDETGSGRIGRIELLVVGGISLWGFLAGLRTALTTLVELCSRLF